MRGTIRARAEWLSGTRREAVMTVLFFLQRFADVALGSGWQTTRCRVPFADAARVYRGTHKSST
jgi:hypothetical protein